MRRFNYSLLIALAWLLVFPQPALAYLDPVTGSIVFQLAVGGLLAAAAVVRLYWGRLRTLFTKRADTKHDVNH